MKFCLKCGKELADDAVVCIGCGCEVNSADNPGQSKAENKLTIEPKTRTWIIIGSIVLLLGVVAAVLFMPRNLEMDNFKRTNIVTAVIQYGLPESIESDEDIGMYLRYNDKVDFYGLTPYSFTVYLDEDRVVLFFNEDDGDKVYDKINRYCDRDKTAYIFHEFSYENLRITTNDFDGSYVNIEIN